MNTNSIRKSEIVDINKIHVVLRLRRLNEETIVALAESIDIIGLLHPIVITDKYELVCGAHRLEAVKRLGWKQIPASFVTGATQEAILLRTIEENLVRANLSDLEVCEHLKLQKELYEKLGKLAKQGDNRFSMENKMGMDEFAKQHGKSKTSIQRKIRIAEKLTPETKELLKDSKVAEREEILYRTSIEDASIQPEIAKRLVEGNVTNWKAARQIIQDVKRTPRVEAIIEAGTGFEDKNITLYHGDFRDYVDALPDNIQLALMDPLYSVEFLNEYDDVAKMLYPKLIPGGFLIFFVRVDFQYEVMKRTVEAGFDYYYTFHIVYTGHKGDKYTSRNVFNSVRPVLIFNKPPCIVQPDYFDDYMIVPTKEKDLYHYQQPLEPCKYLVQKFSQPGDVVVDAFMGSGTIPLAANIEGRMAIGIDRDEKAVGIARGRIAEYQNNNRRVAA